MYHGMTRIMGRHCKTRDADEMDMWDVNDEVTQRQPKLAVGRSCEIRDASGDIELAYA